MSDEAEPFLKGGNEFLFSFNMSNFQKIKDENLNSSFVGSNGENISFSGLSGKELDYALVKYEQTKVQEYADAYTLNNASVDMDNDIYYYINRSMNSGLASSAVKYVMNNYFNPKVEGQHSFYFKNYDDRVLLGQKIIDYMYEEED